MALITARATALLVLLAMFVFFVYQNRGMQLDDALIYARYIDNAISGLGLVYNEGIRFNGLTSPLFSYLVLIVAFVVGDAILASHLLSALCTVGAAWIMALVFHDAAKDQGWPFAELVGWCGAALFLFLPFFFFFYGMETALLSFLSGLLIWLMRRRSYPAAGICAALLFLTRSEALLLVLVVGVLDLIRHRRLPPWHTATYVVPVLLIAAVFAFNVFYYGHILPETGMAKVWQGQSGLWATAHFIRADYLIDWVLRGNLLIFAALLVCACAGFLALGGTYLNRVAMLFLGLYAALYIVLSIPNYGWYYSPFVVFGCYYAGTGFALLIVSAWRFLRSGWKPLGVAMSAVPFVLVLAFLTDINRHPRGAFTPYVEIGHWLRENTEPGTSVAMVEIGTVGYYSGRTIIDILGLVNSDNARYIGERRFDAWLDRYQPDYLLVHEPVWGHEVSVYSAGARWSLREECGLTVAGYRLYRVEHSREPGLHTCDPGEAHRRGVVSIDVPVEAAPGQAGHIDQALIVGNFVLLSGWARVDDQPYGELAYVGHGADHLLWRRMPRPDVGAHLGLPQLEGAGFHAAIRFPSHDQALEAVEEGCLVVMPAIDQDRESNVCMRPPVEAIRR